MSSTEDADFLGEEPIALAERLEQLAEDIRAMANGTDIEELLAGAPLLIGAVVQPRVRPVLAGAVTGHPSLGDTPHCVTSELFVIAGDRTWARTASRFYRLQRSEGRH